MNIASMTATLSLDASRFVSGTARATAAQNTLVSSFDSTTAKLNKSAATLNKMGSTMTAAGRTMTAAVTLPLLAIGAGSLKAAADFESSFAGVRKTVDATEAEFAQLSQGFRDMSREIPVNVNELNRIGEAAGQLGVKKENILAFTDVVAKMGVTTNLSSEQAANAFARISNIMGTAQTDFDRMGSTIVALGNNLATTESEIVEFGLRIAGAGKIAGLTESQVLAIGGAMSSVGVEAEAGGTAVQKVLLGITKEVTTGGPKLAKYAEVAGMSAQEFGTAWKQDAGMAFTAFVEGLGKSGQEAIGILDDLDLKDQRLIRSFLALAGAGDLLRNSIELGNTAWKENSALTEEAQKRFETFQSKWELFKNRIIDVAISLGTALMPAASAFLDLLSRGIPLVEAAVNAFASLPAPLQAVIIGLALIAAAAGPALMMLGFMVQGAGHVLKLAAAYRTLTVTAGPLSTNLRLIGGAVQGTVTNFLAANSAAQMLGKTLRAGFVLGAITYIISKTLEAKAAFEEAEEATKSWIDSLGDGPGAMNDISAAIRTQERALSTLESRYKGFGALKMLNPFEDIAKHSGGMTIARNNLKLLEQGLKDLQPEQVKVHQNSGRLVAANNSLGGAAKALAVAVSTQTAATGELGSAQELGATVAEKLAAAQQMAANFAKAAGEAQAAAAAQAFQGLQLQDEALTEFANSVSSAYNTATSVVQRFGAEAEVTAAQVMKHFADQVEAARNWSTNMVALAKAGIDQGLIAELAQAGPKAAPLVKALLDAVTAGNLEAINKAQADLQTILGDTINQINGQVGPAGAAGAAVGSAAGGSAANSLRSALSTAGADVGNITTGMVSDLNRVGGTHPKPTVTAIDDASGTIGAIASRLGGLKDKVVTVTLRQVTQNVASSALMAPLRKPHSGGPIMHAGGLVPSFHDGGAGLKSDEVMAKMQRGEFVMRRSAVQDWGLGAMYAMNRGRPKGGDGASAPRYPAMDTGGGSIELNQRIEVKLDNKVLARENRKETLRTGRANSSAFGRYS